MRLLCDTSVILDPNQAITEESEVMAPPQEPSEDTIAAQDDHRVRILFERCLIACALYEEFWSRVRMICRYTFFLQVDLKSP